MDETEWMIRFCIKMNPETKDTLLTLFCKLDHFIIVQIFLHNNATV